MRKIAGLFVLMTMALGLCSCLKEGENHSSQSFSDVADSLFIKKADGIWKVSLFCRTLDYSFGKQLNIELVAPTEGDALPVGKFTCRDFSEEKQDGTFISGYLTYDEELKEYSVNGSHIVMNMGYEIYSILFATGSFEIKNAADGKYDFSFIGMDGTSSIQVSIKGEGLKPNYPKPE